MKIWCKQITAAVFVFSTLILFALNTYSQLTVSGVDAGPYTPGSTIAVPFTIGNASCMVTTNVFELYLSDANGNFTGERRIGTYSGFYSTYVNGIIPTNTPAGTGYKVRVKSIAPADVSTESAAFEIKAGTPVRAEVISTALNTPAGQEAFGPCITRANYDLILSNNSSANATVNATVKNEISSVTTSLDLNTPKTFTAQLAHYTVFAKATMPDGTVGTKAYFIINNQAITAFATVNNNPVCLPLASFQFNVDYLSTVGIINNFPGDRYVINWGDGTSTTYTYCDILKAAGKVGHDYTTSSCGRVSTTASGPIYNAFNVSIRVANDFCGNLGDPLSAYAKVVIKPINSFTYESPACTNTEITFTNTSQLGENPNTTSAGCEPNNVTYNWYVDGTLIEANKPRSYNFVYKFLTRGIHTIKLTSVSSGACDADLVEQQICIQDPPKPIFTLPSTTVCAPSTLAPVNISEIDNTCNAVPTYLWTVTPAITFSGGTTAASKDPIFNFTTAGSYTITLSVTSGACGAVVSAPQTVTVQGADAGPDQTLCTGTTATLSGNNEVGIWTQVSGPPATINNPSQNNTTVSDLSAGNNYGFRWTTTGGSCPNSFDEVTISYPAAIINTISTTSGTVCSGQTITVAGTTPTGGIGTYTYQWQSSTDGITWANLPGRTTKDLSISVSSIIYFKRIVTSGFCSSESNSIKLDVLPAIANNAISADQTICEGTPVNPLTGSLPTGANGTFIYQWQSSFNGTTWTDVAGATAKDYTPPQPTVSIRYRRLVTSAACSGGSANESIPILITVNQNAKAEIVYTTDIGCAPFALTPTIVQAGLYPGRNATYTWFANNVQIGTGATFPGYTILTSNASVGIRLVVTSASGCLADETTHTFTTRDNITIAYTQDKTADCGPFSVNFVNTSSDLTGSTFFWDFGNGTTSNLANPPRIDYRSDPAGEDITYTVILRATTACGVITRTSTVLVKAAPISVFSPNKTAGCSPFTTTFSNTSPGTYTSFTYDFGDGSPTFTTNDKSTITHTYITNEVTDYIVKMTATNECGSNTSQYTVRVSPNNIIPELVVDAPELRGCAPLLVNFKNNTKGANTFYYDFGDGASALTNSAPEMVAHTFTKPGTYLVTLYASNDCSMNYTTETIVVLEQPTVGFAADKTIGCSGTVVKFKNNSKNAVAYLWDFGDGTTSNQFEPEHTFTGSGVNYTVTLTATNTQGCKNVSVLPNYIQLVTPPQSNFNVLPGNELSIPNYTFNFRDASLNGAGSWEWNFGDGSSSTLQNPSHTYSNVGEYMVTLKIINKEGCASTSTQMVRVIGVPGTLHVPNSFMPASAKNELRTFKAKGRGIDTWKMTVFNKWGQALWETSKLDDGAPSEGWDGTFNGQEQPQGVYFWKIEVKFINGGDWKGMSYDNSAPRKTGTIYLIR
ncbi:PKD domain-containing protein [Pedobacter aquatilis]|uniref:PKD domain-containing protein n=1 Tax=Pedobacter aquatilis TaxID=351343 RepID=UPI0025B4A5FE|nr:PKD domain-containing protein [Pedobacter aquatilis]MDN3586555.1 PKD domain-containing protein [Pedobacter aquatilis]